LGVVGQLQEQLCLPPPYPYPLILGLARCRNVGWSGCGKREGVEGTREGGCELVR
jgi:hypothetical protein